MTSESQTSNQNLSPKKRKPQTLVIFGDDKGGVTKSTSAGTIVDTIRQFGYSVLAIDGDPVNNTLYKIDPSAAKVEMIDDEILDDLLIEISSMGNPERAESNEANGHDIIILDMPGGKGGALYNYFMDKELEVFEKIGLRIIVALTLVEKDDVIDGIKPWVKAFAGKAEFMIIGNERDSSGEEFDIKYFQKWEVLMNLCKNRLVKIPKYKQSQEKQYDKMKGAPSDYCAGGRCAKELNLGVFQTQGWKFHLSKVMESIEPHLVWLTGRKPPIEHKFTRKELGRQGTGIGSGLSSDGVWDELEKKLNNTNIGSDQTKEEPLTIYPIKSSTTSNKDPNTNTNTSTSTNTRSVLTYSPTAREILARKNPDDVDAEETDDNKSDSNSTSTSTSSTLLGLGKNLDLPMPMSGSEGKN